jgi:hypothetical protein
MSAILQRTGLNPIIDSFISLLLSPVVYGLSFLMFHPFRPGCMCPLAERCIITNGIVEGENRGRGAGSPPRLSPRLVPSHVTDDEPAGYCHNHDHDNTADKPPFYSVAGVVNRTERPAWMQW